MVGEEVSGSDDTPPAPDWFSERWRVRAARRVGLSLIGPIAMPLLRRVRPDVAADVADWSSRRARTEPERWRASTRRSYSVLCYHRLAGEGVPGQERIDLPPGRFATHLRTLRRLGFRPMTPSEVHALHSGEDVSLGRRRYLLTADDGFSDCVTTLARLRTHHAWMFVPTGAVGRLAGWAQGTPVATWEELHALRASGVTIGSHGRTHTPLTDVDAGALREELAGSRDDLHRQGVETTVLAYPNGRHDLGVRDAARQAGYDLAFTTDTGRNGSSTDPLALRRVTPKAWDSRSSLLFKVITGEALPSRWEARRRRSHDAHRQRRARQRARTENLAPARRFRLELAQRRAERAVGGQVGVRVLDAGCQDGLLARSLARHRPDWTIVGLDRDADAVEAARARATTAGLDNISFLVGDVCHAPSTAAFDIVTAMECLAEIEDDASALRSLAAALRPGGRLLLHVPEAEWTPVLRGSAEEWSFGVRHGYREDDLRRLLEEAGLEVVHITPTSRVVLQTAQELRDRFVRGRGVKMRTLALPFMMAAVRLEAAGVTGGRGRALFAEARRP